MPDDDGVGMGDGEGLGVDDEGRLVGAEEPVHPATVIMTPRAMPTAKSRTTTTF